MLLIFQIYTNEIINSSWIINLQNKRACETTKVISPPFFVFYFLDDPGCNTSVRSRLFRSLQLRSPPFCQSASVCSAAGCGSVRMTPCPTTSRSTIPPPSVPHLPPRSRWSRCWSSVRLRPGLPDADRSGCCSRSALCALRCRQPGPDRRRCRPA